MNQQKKSTAEQIVEAQLCREERQARMERLVKKWTKLLERAGEQGELNSFEKQFSQAFCTELLTQAFGLVHPKDFTFEHPFKKKGASANNYADCLVGEQLLIEMKSPHKDLHKAYLQAKNKYWDEIPSDKKPAYIITSDFLEFRVYDMALLKGKTGDLFENDEYLQPILIFKLHQLPARINSAKCFHALIPTDQFLSSDLFDDALPLNRKAAEKIGNLHKSLLKNWDSNHAHDLEILLVRLVFCLFAEDRGDIFALNSFRNFLEKETDDANLHSKLLELFTHLDTPEKFRINTPSALSVFPYVNGGLFKTNIRISPFTHEQRNLLLDCTYFDWTGITPEIFGSIFQSALEPAKRAERGQHYTSAENILKVLKPLFLDGLEEELGEILRDTSSERIPRLYEFQDRLAKIRILDPACGCGNFLVVAYQQLRQLELTALKETRENLVLRDAIKVTIDQFYGIEIEDFPHEVAKLSLWLMQLICDKQASREFSQRVPSLPLQENDNIRCADALETDWQSVLPASQCSYIVGNPPFVGHKQKQRQQGEQLKRILGTKDVDYVCAWYKLAAMYMKQNTSVRAALVSTNSVCQGKHPGLLWKPLFADGVGIDFYYNTFKWSNEAKGVAAVHCVIVGFRYGIKDRDPRYIYRQHQGGIWTKEKVPFISAYGMASPSVIVSGRRQPLSAPFPMRFGNMPADGGNLIIEAKDYEAFIYKEPAAKRWIKRLAGADEFINNTARYCLWLVGASARDIHGMPKVHERVQACKAVREQGSQKHLADTPHLFRDTINPETAILVPSVSSERRKYIPLGFIGSDTIATNLTLFIAGAGLYEFGILTSHMHMVWVRFVCGRLKSDYRYSKDLCYNTFWWPETTEEQKAKVAELAGAIIAIRDERLREHQSSLAVLYDADCADAELMKAHQALDRYVDKIYSASGRGFKSDGARLDFLAQKYKEMTGEGNQII